MQHIWSELRSPKQVVIVPTNTAQVTNSSPFYVSMFLFQNTTSVLFGIIIYIFLVAL